MEPGRILADRYEVLSLVAEGASSTVWEARDAATGEIVAVKAVSLERAGWRAEVRDRFQQEARLLERVRSDHLVGVRAYGETEDGVLYLVLDRLSGETLADRLARPPRPSWREAAGVALELARGLAALHAEGIVHRDLKPANIILHRDDAAHPTPKIIDLGISKASAAAADPALFETLTSTGQVLGTPEYMSYEQAVGERDVDARTDVWALGVVLYEMLASRRPFAGNNANAVLAAIRKGAPAPLAEVARGTPRALAAVVDRCLDRARDGRYADGTALVVALEDAIERGDEEAARAAWRRWALWVGATLGALAVISLAWRAVGGKRATTRPPAELRVEASASASAAVTGTAAAPMETAKAAPSASAPRPPAVKGRSITRVNSAGF